MVHDRRSGLSSYVSDRFHGPSSTDMKYSIRTSRLSRSGVILVGVSLSGAYRSPAIDVGHRRSLSPLGTWRLRAAERVPW